MKPVFVALWMLVTLFALNAGGIVPASAMGTDGESAVVGRSMAAPPHVLAAPSTARPADNANCTHDGYAGGGCCGHSDASGCCAVAAIWASALPTIGGHPGLVFGTMTAPTLDGVVPEAAQRPPRDLG